ncbi:MAG: cell division protein SepF [Candidatus Thermoplasmatota archaeon]|nr:cell division protein SepF [Candidatus Thermoplasmatota archaeon]
MGWLRRKKEEENIQDDEFHVGRSYIDLGVLRGKAPGASRSTEGGPSVKFADIDGYRQIPELSNLVYEGNILVLDFTPIANDDLELKRTITELKRVVEDISGDIAGIAQNMLIITPKGVGIDKTKMKRLERKRF